MLILNYYNDTNDIKNTVTFTYFMVSKSLYEYD